jgi:hypothetical protein
VKKKYLNLSLEKTVLIALLFVLVVHLTIYNSVRYYSLGTDSAGYVDLIRVVAKNGTMVSSIFSSFYSVIPLLTASPDAFCSSELVNLYPASNFLQWHPYFIAYVLALPVKYFGVTALKVAAVINAINLSCSLALIYWFLRRKGLVVWECLSFIFAVSVSQYWVGTIVGQYYFDRLFILPGLVLVLLCYDKWDVSYRAWLVIFFVAMLSSILISERGALYASVLTLGYWVLSKEKRFDSKGVAVLLFSAASLVYLVVYMKFFQNSLYYNGLGWNAAKNNLSMSLISGGALFIPTMKWIGIVLPMVILAFVNWRYGLLAIAALIPNLLVSVGGAEKTGFATHYHAGYIPFLVGFAAIGYATLLNKARAENLSGISWIKKYGKSLLISVAVILSTLATSQFGELRQVYGTIARVNPALEAMVKKRNDFTVFFGSIPAGESVSSPEWTMPALESLGITKVDYMPVGIGSSHYVIAQYVPTSNVPEVTSYLDSSSKKQIAVCIQNKLTSNYRIHSEAVLDGSRYVIYEKGHEYGN